MDDRRCKYLITFLKRVLKFNLVTGSPPKVDTLLASWYRHATISWGNPYFFNENLYQSVSFIVCIDVSRKRSRDSYRDEVCKKSRHCVGLIKIDSQQQRTKIGALGYFTWHESRIRPTPLIFTRSIALHGRRNLPFFGNLSEKASCVDDKTVLLFTLFFRNLPQIRITT